MWNGPTHQVRVVWTDWAEGEEKISCDYMDFNGRVGGLCTGKDFVIATRDCRVLRLPLKDGISRACLSLVLLHSRPITCVDAQGPRVVLGDTDGCLATGCCDTHWMCSTAPLGSGPIYAVKWAPDDPVFAAGDEGGTPSLWAANEHGAPTNLAMFPAHNANNAACTCEHGALNIRDPGCAVSGHMGAVRAVDHVPGGIVTGGADGTVRLWDAETLEDKVISGPGWGPVNSIAVNKRNCRVVAVACTSGPIRVLDTRTSETTMQLTHPPPCTPWESVQWIDDKLIAFNKRDIGIRYYGPWDK